MPKLIFLKGLPGSGKSTWAKEQVLKSQGGIKRVNKDDLREMIDAGKWSRGNEANVLDMQWNLVELFLLRQYDVIVDNTHFYGEHLQKAQSIIDQLNKDFVKIKYTLEVKFFDTPLEECIRRDAKRENPVGKDVILKMWNQYLKPKPIAYNPELPDCIICDLDGTLCLFEGNPYDRDFSQDRVNIPVDRIITTFLSYPPEKHTALILFSGRNGKYRDNTLEWLEKKGIFFDKLVMRQEGDNRADYVVKQEMYNDHILGKYNVRFVIDDRMSVCRKWAELGLFCFCVNQGLIEF